MNTSQTPWVVRDDLVIDTQIRLAPTEYNDPDVAYLSNGNIAVLTNAGRFGTGSTISLNIYDAAGNKVVPEIDPGVSFASLPDFTITGLSDNKLLMTWARSWDIYAKVLDETGTTVVPEFRALSKGRGVLYKSETVATADGGFAVLGEDTRGNETKLAVFDSSGSRLGPETSVRLSGSPLIPDIIEEADLTALPNGDIVVAGFANYGAGVLFDSTGNFKSGFTIPTTGFFNAGEMSVAPLKSGGFAVMWAGSPLSGNPVNSNIGFQLLDAQGNAVGPTKVLDVEVMGDRFDLPEITALSNGDLVAIWTGTPGTTTNIHSDKYMIGKILGPDGSIKVDEFYVNTVPLSRNDSFHFDVAAGPNGEFAVTWYDVDQDAPKMKIFDGDGVPVAYNRDPIITNDFTLPNVLQDQVDVDALDVDGDTLTYAITGGADAARFVIDPATGKLDFALTTDLEMSGDADGDNKYLVTVTVTDGNGGSATRDFRIPVAAWTRSEPGGPVPDDYDVVINARDADDNYTNSVWPTRLSGNDWIDGNDGSDKINGFAGDDYIIAGKGVDLQVSGGSGRDIFQFSRGDDTVKILDFEDGADLLHLLGGLKLSDFTQSSFTVGGVSTTKLTLGTDQIILNGIAPGQLDDSDVWSAGVIVPQNFDPVFAGTFAFRILESSSPRWQTVRADDANGDVVSYSITGGADAARFTVEQINLVGRLSPLNPFDFETPRDADGDNIYEVEITGDDGLGGVVSQLYTWEVLNDTSETPTTTKPQPSDYDTQIYGTSGNDRLIGTSGNDWIDARDGSDSIRGGVGDDYIIAGQGSDYHIYGGAGADIFEFNAKNGGYSRDPAIPVGDRFVKIHDFTPGEDKILLTDDVQYSDFSKKSFVVGGVSIVRMESRTGNDLVFVDLTFDDISFADFITTTGTLNADPVIGGPSSYSIAENTAFVANIPASDADSDTLTYALEGIDARAFTIDASSGRLTFASAPDFERPTDNNVDNIFDLTVRAFDGKGGITTKDLSISVMDVDDTVVVPTTDPKPSDYANEFYGDASDNPIRGTAQSDWIEGGAGNDKINGGAGDDYIIAGSGRDGFVNGGTGADIFQFGLGDGVIYVFDFSVAQDKIALADGLTYADLSKSLSSFAGVDSVIFSTSGGDRLKLRNVDDLDVSQFFTLGETTPLPNRDPMARDDAYTSISGNVLNVGIANSVLANDSDLDEDALSATLKSNAGNGNVTLNANGSFSYTPDAGFTGSDSFVYVVDDGRGGSSSAKVTLTVSGGTTTNPQPSDYVNQFYGDATDNPIRGTAQGDWIEGGAGNDKINGGAGADYIIAGAGRDGFVNGGAGADIFQFGRGDGEIYIFDFEDGVDQIALAGGLTYADLTKTETTFNSITSVLLTTSTGDRLKLRDESATAIDESDFFSLG